MRVWIISSKRYGDSNEVRYVASIPHHDGTVDDDSYWEHVDDKCYAFPTEEKAIDFAKNATSNVCNAAQVQRQELEQVDGDFWDWTHDARPTEVECKFVDPSLPRVQC